MKKPLKGVFKVIDDNATNVKEVQHHILDVFRVFNDFCRQNNLRYYMAWGTALGAVRHEGFIPWDDDLDVCMPRDDYNKFLATWRNFASNHLKLVSWENESEYPYDFAKVYDGRANVVHEVEKKIGRPLPQGIYIDVFPLDYAPNTKVGCFVFWLYYKVVTSQILYLNGWRSCPTFASRIRYLLGFIISIFPPCKKQNAVAVYSKLHCSLNKKGSNYYVDFSFVSTFHTFLFQRMKCGVYGSGKEGFFEGMKVMLPEKVEEYLKASYGDFMVLPDESERIPKHINETEVPWRFL